MSKYFNKPLREKCGYRKLLKKHFCWILSSIFSVFDFSESGSLPLSINALRHVCRRWPISTRSRERKTKIFRSKSAKIVQKLLGLVQFFNLEHQYCQKFLGAVQFLNFILKVVFIQFSCSGALFPLSCPCSATKRTFL